MSAKFLVLTAAGSSSRMGNIGKKEYLPLGTGTVLSQSLRTFIETVSFSCIVITTPKGHEDIAKEAVFKDCTIKDITNNTPIFFIEGSDTRQSSILKALDFIAKSFSNDINDIVLVHDAARPFVTKKIISDVIEATQKYGASVPAIPAVDTQKEINPDGTIKKHLKRSTLACVQTPQGFLFSPFYECHKKAFETKLEVTDDTEIWDAMPEITQGKAVHIVDGDSKNKKITYPEDAKKLKGETAMIKIGFGTDLHKLVEGRKFVLGGIEIPAEKGELGHSDGDVLLHAISDAILGASGLGDIGSYFPPEDPKWKDADSAQLLKTIWADVKAEGWTLNNLDCVVETEKPKFLPWREKVIESIASILEVEKNQIFVKAKTNEKQDSIGSGLAIKAYCCCLLKK